LSTTTITNDTVSNTVSSYSTVRGAQAHSAPGKYYFEIKVLTAPAIAVQIFGVMDDTTANGAPMDSSILPNSQAVTMFNGNSQSNGWNGNNLGSAFALADGDTIAYASDFDNQFYYMSLNNVWFLGGDPTSGASGTGNTGGGARIGERPMLTIYGIGAANSGVYQLKTTSFTFTPPTGYSAWG
jgi:hypothetical protein